MEIPQPPAITGNLFQAAGILYNIYSSYETSKYRENVETGLKIIEGELQDITKMIKEFDRKATYWQQWNELDNPINVIDNAYGYFPDNPTVSADSIATAMMNIHMAICGEAMPVESKNLHLFIEQLEPSKLMTSRIETAYTYFTRYLVGRMVRGFVMLGLLDKALYQEWYVFLTKGNAKSSEEYLAHSFLDYEGRICQQVIDALKGRDSWAGLSNPTEENIKTNQINLGGAADIPDGNAVVGLDFQEAGNSALDVVFWHGKIDKYGYVTNPEKIAPGKGSKKVNAGTRCVPNGNLGPQIAHYGFIDTNKVKVPEGHAIVNLRWRQSTGKFKHYSGYSQKGSPTWSMVYLSVQHAAILAGGKIDMSTAVWTKSKRGDKIKLDTHYMPTVKLPGGVKWYTQQSTIDQSEPKRRQWHHWKTDSPPPQWNTPVTAVQIHSGKAVFRANIHKKLFGSAASR